MSSRESPKSRIVSVVVDNDSWIIPLTEELVDRLNNSGHDAKLCRNHRDVREGYVAFYLSCVKITPKEVLRLNKYNPVVHPSDLPKGRGFSPLWWQVLEGKNQIPVCMFNAVPELDAGPIIYREEISLKGSELIEELREVFGKKTLDLCYKFMQEEEPIRMADQTGAQTYYPRRSSRSGQLDVSKSIADQFELLRISDNERWPAWFQYRGRKYILKVYDEKDKNDSVK
jgi:methionyl-tRNA formyltransferase